MYIYIYIVNREHGHNILCAWQMRDNRICPCINPIAWLMGLLGVNDTSQRGTPKNPKIRGTVQDAFSNIFISAKTLISANPS